MKYFFNPISAEDVDYTVGKLAILAALDYPNAGNLAHDYASAVSIDDPDQETMIGLEIESISNQALYEYGLLTRGS